MKIKTKLARGFTLVELLVVITIIAVLAALASPMILKALQRAKIVKSTGVCVAFETAVNNFENEYNYLPYGGSGSPSSDVNDLEGDSEIVAVLAGRESDINFKQIKFFELGEPKGSAGNWKDGMHVDEASAAMYDPWGGTYHISIDYDLDDELEHPYEAGETVRGKTVIIYSYGPDKEKGSRALNKDNPSNLK